MLELRWSFPQLAFSALEVESLLPITTPYMNKWNNKMYPVCKFCGSKMSICNSKVIIETVTLICLVRGLSLVLIKYFRPLFWRMFYIFATRGQHRHYCLFWTSGLGHRPPSPGPSYVSSTFQLECGGTRLRVVRGYFPGNGQEGGGMHLICW